MNTLQYKLDTVTVNSPIYTVHFTGGRIIQYNKKESSNNIKKPTQNMKKDIEIGRSLITAKSKQYIRVGFSIIWDQIYRFLYWINLPKRPHHIWVENRERKK